MNIDPRDYDLEELRGLPAALGPDTGGSDRIEDDRVERGERDAPRAHGFGSRLRSSAGDTETDRSGREARTDRYRRLLAIERASGGDLAKPYLTDLPGTASQQVAILEWLDSLLQGTGRRGTIEALRYYRGIGWISGGVEADLGNYLGGFDAGDATGTLAAADHLDSLIVIARLAAARGNE